MLLTAVAAATSPVAPTDSVELAVSAADVADFVGTAAALEPVFFEPAAFGADFSLADFLALAFFVPAFLELDFFALDFPAADFFAVDPPVGLFLVFSLLVSDGWSEGFGVSSFRSLLTLLLCVITVVSWSIRSSWEADENSVSCQ